MAGGELAIALHVDALVAGITQAGGVVDYVEVRAGAGLNTHLARVNTHLARANTHLARVNTTQATARASLKLSVCVE